MTQTLALDWQQSAADNNDQIDINTTLAENQIPLVHQAVLATVDKAIELLAKNIDDNSRYFIAEWNKEQATLSIVLTDDSKQLEAKYKVSCLLTAFETHDNETQQEISSEIKHWIQNYLTTHSGFMQFSLVAVFTDNSRANTQLL